MAGSPRPRASLAGGCSLPAAACASSRPRAPCPVMAAVSRSPLRLAVPLGHRLVVASAPLRWGRAAGAAGGECPPSPQEEEEAGTWGPAQPPARRSSAQSAEKLPGRVESKAARAAAARGGRRPFARRRSHRAHAADFLAGRGVKEDCRASRHPPGTNPDTAARRVSAATGGCWRRDSAKGAGKGWVPPARRVPCRAMPCRAWPPAWVCAPRELSLPRWHRARPGPAALGWGRGCPHGAWPGRWHRGARGAVGTLEGSEMAAIYEYLQANVGGASPALSSGRSGAKSEPPARRRWRVGDPTQTRRGAASAGASSAEAAGVRKASLGKRDPAWERRRPQRLGG